VRKCPPNEKPYFGPDREIVIETSNILELLQELGTYRQRVDTRLDDRKASIRAFLADPINATAVPSDQAKREEFLTIVQESPAYCQPTLMIDFLSRVLDPIWARATGYKGFPHYDTYIKLLIDILERIKVHSVNPGILFYLGDALDRVGWYLDKDKPPGSAHAATDSWLAQHHRITDEVKRELRSYADAYDRSGLAQALEYAGLGAA
jgi:hypothetical protein